MVDEELTRAFAEDIVYLLLAGIHPVVVHGGGPQISAALTRAGIESQFVGGYRVTTLEAIGVVRDVLVGEVGAGLVSLINEHGDFAVGVPGDTEGLLTGVRRGAVVGGETIDLGLAGEATSVDPRVLLEQIEAGRVPVISTVALEEGTGQVLNVNADSAAASVAIALGAAKLVVLTDVAGLYRDWPDRGSLVSVITTDELAQLLPSLESGMIPKMTACLEAVRAGVAKAAIIDGRVQHSILLEVFTQGGIGTEVVPS
jgi:acetylglutamate kinase